MSGAVMLRRPDPEEKTGFIIFKQNKNEKDSSDYLNFFVRQHFCPEYHAGEFCKIKIGDICLFTRKKIILKRSGAMVTGIFDS